MENPNQDQAPSGKLLDTFIEHYNPVYAKEVIGTLFLGILAVILLILYVCSLRRYQKLLEKFTLSNS